MTDASFTLSKTLMDTLAPVLVHWYETLAEEVPSSADQILLIVLLTEALIASDRLMISAMPDQP